MAAWENRHSTVSWHFSTYAVIYAFKAPSNSCRNIFLMHIFCLEKKKIVFEGNKKELNVTSAWIFFFAIRDILTWLLVHCLLLIALIFTVPSENSSRKGGISVAMASGTFATTLAGLVSTVIIYVQGDYNINIFFIMKSTVNSLCRAWRHFSYPCPMSSTQGQFWSFELLKYPQNKILYATIIIIIHLIPLSTWCSRVLLLKTKDNHWNTQGNAN